MARHITGEHKRGLISATVGNPLKTGIKWGLGFAVLAAAITVATGGLAALAIGPMIGVFVAAGAVTGLAKSLFGGARWGVETARNGAQVLTGNNQNRGEGEQHQPDYALGGVGVAAAGMLLNSFMNRKENKEQRKEEKVEARKEAQIAPLRDAKVLLSGFDKDGNGEYTLTGADLARPEVQGALKLVAADARSQRDNMSLDQQIEAARKGSVEVGNLREIKFSASQLASEHNVDSLLEAGYAVSGAYESIDAEKRDAQAEYKGFGQELVAANDRGDNGYKILMNKELKGVSEKLEAIEAKYGQVLEDLSQPVRRKTAAPAPDAPTPAPAAATPERAPTPVAAEVPRRGEVAGGTLDDDLAAVESRPTPRRNPPEGMDAGAAERAARVAQPAASRTVGSSSSASTSASQRPPSVPRPAPAQAETRGQGH